MEEVDIKRRGGVLLLMLSRPHKLNALSPTMLEDFRTGMAMAAADDVHVLVIAGEGSSFCAGGDMEFLALDDLAAGHRYISEVTDILAALRQFPKPIVAAVQGYAVGAGAEIALEADLIVLSTDAVFRFPDVGIGSTPATLYRLVRLVGLAMAARMALLGDDLSANTAAALGIPCAVVPPERLLEEAMSIAGRLDGLNPSSLRLAKQALGLAQGIDGMADLRANLEAEAACYESPAMRAAVADFLAGRSSRTSP